MMPHRTPQEERQRTAELKAALLCVGLALRDWNGQDPTALIGMLENHSGDNDKLLTDAALVLAAMKVQP
jgi:hypothetical protein